jgi:hypothetical protein
MGGEKIKYAVSVNLLHQEISTRTQAYAKVLLFKEGKYSLKIVTNANYNNLYFSF